MHPKTIDRYTPDVSNLSPKLPAEIHTAMKTIAAFVVTASEAPPQPGVDLIRTRQSVESLVAAINATVA